MNWTSSRIDHWLGGLLRALARGRGSAPAKTLDAQAFVRLGMLWLGFVYRDAPVPIERVLRLRRWGHGEDVLFPELQPLITTGRALKNPFLARRLADAEVGAWSPPATTLNFLEKQIRALKPKLVLEFGSGISTACLGRYMQEVHGDSDRIYVVSIEQELGFAAKTRQLVEGLQLDKYVRIIHSPLREQVIAGIPTTCYDLSGDILRAALNGRRADFIFIDGPCAEPGARFGTLPLTRPLVAPGARFYLDDSLRDGELQVAQLWSRVTGVDVQGMYVLGKGLLAGQVHEMTSP